MAEIGQIIRKATNIAAMKAMHEFIAANAGSPVHFIYNASGHSPCHATVKRKAGPWSFHRLGFCGTEPGTGPIPAILNPDGGLCSTCTEYIEKINGVWRVRNTPKFKPVHHSVDSPSLCSYDDD